MPPPHPHRMNPCGKLLPENNNSSSLATSNQWEAGHSEMQHTQITRAQGLCTHILGKYEKRSPIPGAKERKTTGLQCLYHHQIPRRKKNPIWVSALDCMAAHVKNRQSDYHCVYVWRVMQTILLWVNRESNFGLGNEVGVGWGCRR